MRIYLSLTPIQIKQMLQILCGAFINLISCKDGLDTGSSQRRRHKERKLVLTKPPHYVHFPEKHFKPIQNYEQQKHVLDCGGRVGALAFGNCPSGWRYDFRNAIFLARIVSGESGSSCDGRGGDGRSERSRNKSPIVSKGAPGACPAIACTPKYNLQYEPCKGWPLIAQNSMAKVPYKG